MEMYFVYECEKGDIRVDYNENGVTGVFLPYDWYGEINNREYLENEEIKKHFDDYFAGGEPKPLKLNIKVTEFQQKVFDILLNTKIGTFMTYGDVARLIHCGSNQAIGQALKRNPVPIIIACHRVVGKGWDGGFGGETTGEKMEFKKFLLQLEKKISD